jgi:hypothetical protein
MAKPGDVGAQRACPRCGGQRIQERWKRDEESGQMGCALGAAFPELFGFLVPWVLWRALRRPYRCLDCGHRFDTLSWRPRE